jgi:O-acetyl-ADP-ribose deacetylase (regulator of RNase III)
MGDLPAPDSLLFRVGDVEIAVSYTDITTLSVDVIVSSDDTDVSMGGGLSGTIRERAGDVVFDEAQKQLPAKHGDVLVTSGGKLPAKNIFHALVINYDRPDGAPTVDIIRGVVRRCIELCVRRRARTIAFPALAIGTAGLPPEVSASAILVEAFQILERDPPIDRIHIALDPAKGDRSQRFFWEVKQYLELSAATRKLRTSVAAVAELAPSTAETPDHDRLARVQATLDAGLLRAGTSDHARPLAEARAKSHEAIVALDKKLRDTLIRSVDDPTRLQSEILRLQIHKAYLERTLLKYDDLERGESSPENQARQAFLKREEDALRAELATLGTTGRSLVLSVHGIRTRGQWQKAITRFLEDAGFSHEPHDYGRFGLLRFMWPAARHREVERFRALYESATARTATGHPSVIAHSFGTLIVTDAIANYDLRFDQVIFCGGIVKPDYDWAGALRGGFVKRVLNDHGRQDIWARVARYIVSEAGRSGLSGFENPPGAVINRDHKQFGHSAYFFPSNYTDSWIPFLKGGQPGELANLRDTKRNWHFVATGMIVGLLLIWLLWRLLG